MAPSQIKKWRIVRLRDIADIDRNGIDPSAIKSGTLYVGLEHITGEGRFTNVDEVANGELASTKFVFSCSHILYGKLRPYLRKIALPSFRGVCSTDILPILPSEAVDREYLYHYLRQPKMVELATTRSAGANLPRVSPKILEEFEILLPPVDEQRCIAAVLNKADALREKRRQAIHKLDTLLQSVFLDMFGDPVVNPKAWGVRKLVELGSLDRGKSKHRPRNAPELLGGKYPLIQTGDVANAEGYVKTYSQSYSEVGLKQSRMWPSGTLCITIAANIAKTAILTFDACFPDSMVGFTPNDLTTTEFIQHWISFRQKELEQTAPESAQKNINLRTLRDLDVPLPPKDAQIEFSGVVRKVEALKDRFRDAIIKSDTLFSSLQQRAFSGELLR